MPISEETQQHTIWGMVLIVAIISGLLFINSCVQLVHETNTKEDEQEQMYKMACIEHNGTFIHPERGNPMCVTPGGVSELHK